MGLIKLLSVNQTFTGVTNAPSPYHVTQPNWLPRFGMDDISELPEKESMKTDFKFEAPAGAPTAPDGDHAEPAKAIQPVKGRWLSSHYPQKANRPLRQPELCLESVKVMRNDLRDSDIDIVPMKNGRAARAAHIRNETPDLFGSAPSNAKENLPANPFTVSGHRGGVRTDSNKKNNDFKPTDSASRQPFSDGAIAAKKSGYLGLSILTRWFGLGRSRAH
jgi:hypothetical protein